MPTGHNPPDPEANLDRELSAWVDELAARYAAQGLPAQEARRRALIDTEGVEQVKERVRDSWRWSPARAWDRIRLDTGVAIRLLRNSSAMAAVAVITMAAAVGLNLAMLGLIDRAILSPPALVSDPTSVFVMSLRGRGDRAGAIRTAASYPTFRAIRDSVTALAGTAAFQRASGVVSVSGDQREVERMIVSDNYFELLGVRPVVGAGILPRPADSSRSCVLSHALWQSTFAGDPRIVGRHLTLGGLDYVIAGVMPAGFSGHTAEAVDIWVTFEGALRTAPEWATDEYRSLATLVVRTRPQVPVNLIDAQMQAAVDQHVSLSPIAGVGIGANERRVAWWLTGTSVLVLVPAGNEARLMQYFVPFSQVPYPSFVPPGRNVSGVLLRTSADLEQLAPMIRRALTSDRQDVPFIRVVPYKQLLEPQLKPWRTATTLLALFSALALGVAMIGLYAVFAHAVSERRHEMAVRVAIGARPSRVFRMVLRETVLIAGAGCVVGAVASVFAGRAVQALLFETSSADPVTLGGVTLLMLIACVGATVVPAAVASNADPSTLLKEGGQR
jgi:hypothetical protein